MPAVAADEGITYQGSVDLGVGILNLDHPNPKYGEYSDLSDDDNYLIGNIDLVARQDVMFLDLSAIDLGLNSRRVDIGIGHTGAYSLDIHYDQIPHLIAVDAMTPFSGAGGDRLSLPGGFTPATTTSGMTDLAASLRSLELETERKRTAIQYKTVITEDWQATFSISREKKEGTQSLGAVVAQNGGAADSTVLPQPVDYETDEFQAGIAYGDDIRQFEISYFLSMFDNEYQSITWDVPYLDGSPFSTSGYPAIARIGLPSDNQHQRLSINGGMVLPATSHLSAVVEFGEMSQDELLLPYSTDDIGGTDTLTEDGNPLPRTSAQARIDVTHLMVNLTSRPLPKLGVSARYRFYQTDNKTPYTFFERVVDDTVPQSQAPDSYSRPYDLTRSQWDIDGTYRFDNGLMLRAGLEHESVDYRYREVEETVEDVISFSLRKRLTRKVTGKLSYQYSDREAKDYDAFRSYSTLFDSSACPTLATVDPDPDTGGVTTIDTCFDNHPDLRKFDIASRKRSKINLVLMANPFETLDLGLTISSLANEYSDSIEFDDTYLGLTSTGDRSITLDASYIPNETWALYTYFTHEQLESAQTGRSYGFAAGDPIDSSLNWWAEFENKINTIGVNADINILYDELVLRVGYTVADESGNTHFATGSALTAVDMPEDKTRRQTVEMSGIYSINRDVELNVGVIYEIFKVQDWQRDSVEAGGISIDDVLPLTGPLTDYKALLIYTSLTYHW